MFIWCCMWSLKFPFSYLCSQPDKDFLKCLAPKRRKNRNKYYPRKSLGNHFSLWVLKQWSPALPPPAPPPPTSNQKQPSSTRTHNPDIWRRRSLLRTPASSKLHQELGQLSHCCLLWAQGWGAANRTLKFTQVHQPLHQALPWKLSFRFSDQTPELQKLLQFLPTHQLFGWREGFLELPTLPSSVKSLP